MEEASNSEFGKVDVKQELFDNVKQEVLDDVEEVEDVDDEEEVYDEEEILDEEEVIEIEDVEDYEEFEDEEDEELEQYKLQMGIRTMSDEFGKYDAPASVQQGHAQTTVRLVTEFLEKTGASASVLETDAFYNMITQLNPAAHVPTENDIRDYLYNSPQHASPTQCIVCGAEPEECDVLTLSVNVASLVLTTTIMALNREPNEAAKKILSGSLRCCVVHMNEMCRYIISAFELDELRDFNAAPQYKIGEWCIVFKRIKMRNERIDNPNFGPSKLICLLSAFLAEYAMDPPQYKPPPLENERTQADINTEWDDIDLDDGLERARENGYLGKPFPGDVLPEEGEEEEEEEEEEEDVEDPEEVEEEVGEMEGPEVITLENGPRNEEN